MERILIVDDNREFGELLGHWFEQWSIPTVVVTTVADARKAVLEQEPFRMVICDFQLPDGNGLEFFTWLRWDRQNPVRFLMISGSTNFVRYGQADFGFLRKPFQLEDLRSAVENLLGIRLGNR